MPINECAGAKKKPDDTCITQAIGLSIGALSTKIHATSDALGNPTGFHLTPGLAHDLQGADVLLDSIDEIGALLADKAYDAEQRVRLAPQRGQLQGCHSSQKQPHSTHGNTIKTCTSGGNNHENLFQKLKQYRAIATRYDKTARNFLGAIHLAAAIIWLN
ncbi:transposase [Moorena bouillonii]|uniref:transposase n=1 Tax=Moorena bouillonii TaxID=207920 RepID=UPI00096A3A7F